MTQPERRLAALRAHLAPPIDEDAAPPLAAHPTAAPLQEDQSYCVVLPEKLTPQGPWLVRR
jgi:hypothetical protein